MTRKPKSADVIVTNLAAPPAIARLSDAAMRASMAELKKRIANDRNFALDLLKGAGIANSKGKLSKKFGG